LLSVAIEGAFGVGSKVIVHEFQFLSGAIEGRVSLRNVKNVLGFNSYLVQLKEQLFACLLILY